MISIKTDLYSAICKCDITLTLLTKDNVFVHYSKFVQKQTDPLYIWFYRQLQNMFM